MKNYSDSLEEKKQTKEQSTGKNKKKVLNDASKNIVMNHLHSFISNNLDALLSDYTNESVLITQNANYSGPEEIRAFFVDLNMHFPEQNSNLVLDKVVANDDLVFIVWHAETPTLQVPIGSDTFIIKNGKIHQQTFAGQLNFINQ